MTKTTFERLMKSYKFKEKYEKRYREFLLDELILAIQRMIVKIRQSKNVRLTAREERVGMSNILEELECPKCGCSLGLTGSKCYPEDGIKIECNNYWHCNYFLEVKSSHRNDLLKEALINMFNYLLRGRSK